MRLAVLTTLVCCAAGPALADSDDPFATVETREHGPVKQVGVTYAAGTETVRAWLFLPAGGEAAPAVIFCHPGFGLEGRMRRRCLDLAAAGYVVLAPEYRPEAAARFTVTAGETERILAGDALLRRHRRVVPTRVGIVGSSHGALAALSAVAESPPRHFACAVNASGNRWLEDRAAEIRTPLLIQVGKQDREMDYQEGRLTGLLIKKAGNSTVTIEEYTLAGHDLWFWTDPVTFTSDEIAQGQWAWEDILAFLGRYLSTTITGAVR